MTSSTPKKLVISTPEEEKDDDEEEVPTCSPQLGGDFIATGQRVGGVTVGGIRTDTRRPSTPVSSSTRTPVGGGVASGIRSYTPPPSSSPAAADRFLREAEGRLLAPRA